MTTSRLIQRLLDALPFRARSVIKNIPVIKQIQALIVNKLMYGKEINARISGGPAEGLVFPVKLPQDKQMWIGTWELEFAQVLKNYVRPGWVCYDIGGYKGYYAGIMALKGASEVFVFEPMPQNTDKIKKLIELNPGLPLQLKPYAVSDYSGKAVFKIMPDDTMGKLENSSFQQGDMELQQLEVDCITLDDLLLLGIPAPDMIKIDVEGAEELVLKGGTGVLKARKPLLMIEVHSAEIGQRCMSILSQYYSSVTVLETGMPPQPGYPGICHYIASDN